MRVLTPTTADDAVRMLAECAHDAGAPATVMNGGTDLMVEWPLHLERHTGTYVDLSAIAELRLHRWTDDALIIGGTTTYWDLVRDERAGDEFPVLIRAARQVGAVQIQARGTWAGNIVNASPAADGVPALMAYDAEVILRGPAGERAVRLDEFYLGYKKMRMEPGDLVVAIRVPRIPRGVAIFEKVGSRKAQAITKVGLAITHADDAGWRVVANSVAETVRRCRAIEGMLEGRVPVGGAGDFYGAIDRDVKPIDDIRSTAAYRRSVMARLLYQDLRQICDWIT
jgi:CO/xanthine dehydrogenase FAD-binding subunit